MSLVVGHTCPGCGLDTPEVACEACGASVVWDRKNGSYCSACGLSAATITCRECGLRAELDKRHAEHHARALVRPSLADNADRDGDDGAEALSIALASALTESPVVRAVAVVGAIGLHGALIALLIGGGEGPGQPGVTIGALSADVMVVETAPFVPVPKAQAAPHPDQPDHGVAPLPFDALPVTLPPPRPVAVPSPPAPANPRVLRPPPPHSIARAVRDADKVYGPPSAAPPPRRAGWLQRVLRSGSVSSNRAESIYGDSATSGAAGAGGSGGGGSGGGSAGGGGGGAGK